MKKRWIILGIIICFLIVIYIITRILLINNLTNEGYETINKELLEIINNGIKHEDSNIENISDINELKQRNLELKDQILMQINKLEIDGEIEIEEPEQIYYCNDGTVEYHNSNENSDSFCDYNNTELGDLKKIKINNSGAIIIMLPKMLYLIPLIDYSLSKLENINNEEKEYITIISHIITTLDFLDKTNKIGQTSMDIYYLRYNETDLFETDMKQAIRIVKEKSISMDMPSEQQINNLVLKESCIKSFNDADKDSKSKQSSLLKSTSLHRIFFIKNTIPKICEKIELFEKQTALEILKNSKTESNQFVLIDNKLYLNLLVKCTDEWLSIKKDKPCTETYLKEYQNEFNQAIFHTNV